MAKRKASNVPLHDAAIALAKDYHQAPSPFVAYVQAQADKEAMAKLVEAYGADVKPEKPHTRIDSVVLSMYKDLKHRIVTKLLLEAGYVGRRNTWPVNFYAEEFAIMPKDEAKPEQTKEKEDTRKHDYVETAHGEFRKDSVLHIIYKGIAKRGGSTKAEIHAALKEQFPDWDDTKSTVNCQLDRMDGERGFKLARTAAGKYGIEPQKAPKGPRAGEHMEFSGLSGWDSTRVRTPEQESARKAKEDAKAKAKGEKEKEKAAKAAEKEKAAKLAADAKAKAKAEDEAKAAKEAAAESAKKAKAAKLAG